MESKIIECGIILLHKYKVEQTEVISRLLFTFFLKNFKNVWSDKTFTFSYHVFIVLSWLRYHEFRKYPSNHTLKVYKAPKQTQHVLLRKCKHTTFYKAFVRL